MTLASLFKNVEVLSIFLLVGYILYEMVPFFRKFFLPASVIGGFIALIGGPQLLGLWEIPPVFGAFANVLIILIMTCLIWGIKVDRKRLVGYVDYVCFFNTLRFAQIGIGALTGIILRYIWTDLPLGWGSMTISAYLGGHGTVASYSSVFESLGYNGADYQSIGMVMATLGMLCAIIVGTVFVNIYVRKGQGTFTKPGDKLGTFEEKGLLPKEKQNPIGTLRVSSNSINALIFQLAMLLVVALFGQTVLKLLGVYVWPTFGKLPNMLYGLVGSVIIWPIMGKLNLQDYVDRKTCSQISGCCLDMLICGAIATLNLKIFAAFFAPIMINFVAVTAITAFICFWYNQRIAEDEWLEKALFVFGQATGSTPTGLALVRAIDPDSRSCAAEAHAVQSGTIGLLFSWIPALLPALATSSFPESEILFGFIPCILFAIAGWVLFRKKVRALGR